MEERREKECINEANVEGKKENNKTVKGGKPIIRNLFRYTLRTGFTLPDTSFYEVNTPVVQ
jgi:hypothetical protein